MSIFQLLERAGQWSQVAETSQLISDIKYRLIYIFQYHRDFYHPEEDYLQVGTLAAVVVYKYKYYLQIFSEKAEILLWLAGAVGEAIQREELPETSHSVRVDECCRQEPQDYYKTEYIIPTSSELQTNTPNYSSQPNDTHMSKYLRPKSQAKHL